MSEVENLEPESESVNSHSESDGPFEDDILLEEMIRSFVSYPDNVKVVSSHSGEQKILTVTVHDEDRGKVIGKQGRVIKILQDFFGVVGFRNGYPIMLKVHGDTNFFRNNPGIAPPPPQQQFNQPDFRPRPRPHRTQVEYYRPNTGGYNSGYNSGYNGGNDGNNGSYNNRGR